MTKRTEEQLKKGAEAILVLLNAEVASLFTTPDGQCTLVNDETGQTYVVTPQLMDYMIEHDYVVADGEYEE